MQLNTVTISPVNSGGFFGINVWVQAATRARVRFRASDVELDEGETITGYSFTFKGDTYTAANGAATTSTAVRAGENEFVCTVHGTDADGNEISSSITSTVTAYSYDPPTAEYTVCRCDLQGNEDNTGGYIKLTPTVSISSCGGHNTATNTVRFKLRSDALYTEGGSVTGNTPLIFGGGDIEDDRSYDLLVTITDTAGFSREYSLVAYSDYWAMRFSGDGRGVAFCKGSATSGRLELASGMSFTMGNTTMTEAQLSALLNPAPVSAGFSLTTVWTNPNAAQTFNDQTMNVPGLSDYNLLLIQFKLTTGLPYYSFTIVFPDGLETMALSGSKSGTNYDYKRTIKWNGDDLVFSNGFRNATGGTGNMIPNKIFGVKW